MFSIPWCLIKLPTETLFTSTMRSSRIFYFRGGGESRPQGQKIVWTMFFLCFVLVLNLFYSLQRGSNGFVTEKTILFQGSRRGPTFSRGGGGGGRGLQLFSRGGGVQMLISTETHITCDFQGFRTPYPLLWIRTCPRFVYASKEGYLLGAYPDVKARMNIPRTYVKHSSLVYVIRGIKFPRAIFDL